MPTVQDLSTFLSYATKGQKEAALVIADSHISPEIEASLQGGGFVKATKPLMFLKSIYQKRRPYIVLDEDNAKDIYDICLQYPTGQINFLNRSKMITLFVQPDYDQSAIIILATKSLLETLEKKGFNFRSVAGLTQQV